MGANIVAAGHGLEVGAELELLKIRQAEAVAEETARLSTRCSNMPQVCLLHLL